MALAPVMSAFLMSSLNFLVYFIMGSLALSFKTFDHLYNLSNSKYDLSILWLLLSRCLGPLFRSLSTVVLHH